MLLVLSTYYFVFGHICLVQCYLPFVIMVCLLYLLCYVSSFASVHIQLSQLIMLSVH